MRSPAQEYFTLREKLCLSRKQFAALMGYGKAGAKHVSEKERGSRPISRYDGNIMKVLSEGLEIAPKSIHKIVKKILEQPP